MNEYIHLLNDPKFEDFLRDNGYLKSGKKEYEGKITLADGVERKLNWNFASEASLKTLMINNGIEKIDPINNLVHFSMVLYSMIIEDMVSDGGPNDKFISLDDLIKIMPTNANDLHVLVDVMNFVFGRGSKNFSAV